jgi:hypothetical protein
MTNKGLAFVIYEENVVKLSKILGILHTVYRLEEIYHFTLKPKNKGTLHYLV